MGFTMLFLLLAVSLVAADEPRVSTQDEHSDDLVFSSSYDDVVPKIVFDFLEEFNWGDFHQVFHMARKYHFLGDQSRRWLKQVGEKIPELQEGDPLNGIEFLAMHRSMIQQLKDLFGDEKVTNDPEGFQTMNQVLDGWTTDADVIKGLQKVGGDVAKFKAGLEHTNNFAQFKSEDEFGNFLQTSLRLVDETGPRGRRSYDYDRRAGAGVHNWLHGQFHTNSPITVGNPRSNLANIMFWRIHGWIEAKWIQFEKTRSRTPEEQMHYDRFMKQFDSTMDGMAQGMPGAIRDDGMEDAGEVAEEEAVRHQREEREREELENRARAEREETREREERERQEREREETRERELRERREADDRLKGDSSAEEPTIVPLETATESAKVLCTIRDITIRSKTGRGSKRVAKLQKGDLLTVVQVEDQDWYKVTKSDGVTTGFLRRRYLGECPSTGRELLSVVEHIRERRSKRRARWSSLRAKLRRAFRIVKKVPKAVVKDCMPVMFTDHVDCSRYDEDITTPDCPAGNKKK